MSADTILAELYLDPECRKPLHALPLAEATGPQQVTVYAKNRMRVWPIQAQVQVEQGEILVESRPFTLQGGEVRALTFTVKPTIVRLIAREPEG